MSNRFIKESSWRYLRAIYDGGKVPRKAKKHYLGTRMSSCALKRLLRSVKVEIIPDPQRPSYPEIKILPFAFCPNCGETESRIYHRSGYYPEVWDTIYCLRCGKVVAEADNSPMIHVLQYKTYCDL